MERLLISARARTHTQICRSPSLHPALFQFNYSTLFQYIPFFNPIILFPNPPPPGSIPILRWFLNFLYACSLRLRRVWPAQTHTPRVNHLKNDNLTALEDLFFNLDTKLGCVVYPPAALLPGKEARYILFRRMGGPNGCGKSPPQPGFYPGAIQPVASLYTDWAIPTHDYFLNNVI